MLASYEHDFTEHINLLREITDDSDPASMLEKNKFAMDNAQKLLKQMEVEAMNFMDDDNVRKRVSFDYIHMLFSFPCHSLTVRL